MRLAIFERDSWQLRSGEKSHREYPDTFIIPPLELRQNLKRGQAVKLIFDIQVEDECGNISLEGERMWVLVTERIGDQFFGILDCQPSCIDADAPIYLRVGAEVSFAPEHVIEIDDPPPDYVEDRLSQSPTRRWSRSES